MPMLKKRNIEHKLMLNQILEEQSSFSMGFVQEETQPIFIHEICFKNCWNDSIMIEKVVTSCNTVGLENAPISSRVSSASSSSSSSSSSSRTQNPRKRMRSVHCVQFWDKAPSTEERSGWLSGPSCSTLSPGGGWGWAGNTGRARRGSQRKGEGGKTFTRPPPPSRHSSPISPC